MDITVKEAGRRGGQETSRRHGREHYREIGMKGQIAMREKYPDMAHIWGKMGGRPRKKTLAEIEEEVRGK